MTLQEFLNTVISTPQGYFCLAAANQDGWREFWFEWPAEKNEIIYKAKELTATHNVYFSAHLFSAPNSAKEYVLPTRTIQADLDSASVFSAPVAPTVVVETSPSRTQCYWIVGEPTPDTSSLERWSRRLTYAIPDCDKTGWPLGKRVRLPDTYNFKYDSRPPVTILSASSRRLDSAILDAVDELVPDEAIVEADMAWVEEPHSELDLPPMELVRALEKDGKIAPIVRQQYSNPAKDRSAALWRLMCECFSAGLGRDLVYWIAFNSENNKFRGRYLGVRDLRKDVLRAEAHHDNKNASVRAAIDDIRREPKQSYLDRNGRIADLIIQDLGRSGTFFHARDGQTFYVPKSSGRPIELPNSYKQTNYWLDAILGWKYGVNASLGEHKFVISAIITHVRNLTASVDVHTLSYYDQDAKKIYLHTGTKDIYVIGPTGTSLVENGNHDVLFLWGSGLEPFHIVDAPLPNNQTWYELLFDSTLHDADGDTITNLTRREALAILAVWLMFLLFKSASVSRPILALLGAPGAGKSAVARKIYRLLYGKKRALHMLTSRNDFDFTTMKNPLVIFDNVDSWERWLADSLAQSISAITFEQRELYTNRDTVELTRDSMLGITAHQPHFLRADVADRLLVIYLRRRNDTSFRDETELMNEVSNNRGALWGAIVRDLQKIISNPVPRPEDTPPFRIKDFATLGVWIARGIGEEVERDFVSGITATRETQKDTVMEEEDTLIVTLEKWAEKGHGFVPPGVLFNTLQIYSPNPALFTKIYKTPVVLSKKLFTLKNVLERSFAIEYRQELGTRLWKIGKKDG